jgi:hypothetical protein
VQPENSAAAAGNSSTTVNSTMETQPANPAPLQPASYQKLEQQGYTVFVPGYLPPDYSLVSYSPQPPVYATGAAVSAGSTQGAAAPPGRDSLLFTYHDQSGGWLTLEIQPLNGSAPSPPAITTAGPVASANTVNQPPGTNRITKQAQKNGASFMLTVAGSLPVAELQKVADSLQ